MNHAAPAAASDDELALRRLLGLEGGNASPVATPDMLVNACRWMAVIFRKAMEEQPARSGQIWGRLADIQRLYGVSKSQANDWMMRLKAEGKVRTQNPISGAQGNGSTFYHLGDIEDAYTENAQAVAERRRR